MTQFAPVLEIIGTSFLGRIFRVFLFVLEIADFSQMLGLSGLVEQLQVNDQVATSPASRGPGVSTTHRRDCQPRIALPARFCGQFQESGR